MRVFLDANIVMYLIEQPSQMGPAALALLREMRQRGDQIVVGRLVRMECQVGPLKAGDEDRLSEYEAFFASQSIEMAELFPETFDLAARLRAAHSLRPVDALNLATALTASCDALATNDFRLQRVPGLRIIALTP